MKKIIFIIMLTLSVICVCSNTYAQIKISRPSTYGKTPTPKPKPQTKVSDPDGEINGHGYVDLGLPSGTKWATCNVGANNPSDYGNYYAWGETRPKSNYDWSNCFDCLDNSGNRWDFYKIGGNTQISPYSGHDTARENWGGTWRMPTETELEELINKCTWRWTSINGKKGYEVTGPNKKSIFLPAAGCKYGTELRNVGKNGYYWFGTLSSYYSYCARYLSFDGSYRNTYNYYRRCGLSVRPVTE